MLLLKKFISDYFITNDERIKNSFLYTPVYANNSIFCKKPDCHGVYFISDVELGLLPLEISKCFNLSVHIYLVPESLLKHTGSSTLVLE